MTALEHALLNDWQRDFPLVPNPFAVIAERLSCDEESVLEEIGRASCRERV